MAIIPSILSLSMLGLLTAGPEAEMGSTLLANQVRSDADGMSECVIADMVDGEKEIFGECNGFRGVVLNTQNIREFHYEFPGGILSVYTDFNSASRRFPDGVTLLDGRRSRSYFINQVFLNGEELDIQAILTSERRRNFRCYVIDDYAGATCDLPDGTFVTYER